MEDGSRKPSEVVLERGVVTGDAEKPGPESRQLVGLPDLSLWDADLNLSSFVCDFPHKKMIKIIPARESKQCGGWDV